MPQTPDPPHRRRWISLCAALTGIAFGEMLSLEGLREQLTPARPIPPAGVEERLRAFFYSDDGGERVGSSGTGNFADHATGIAAIEAAWRALREKAGQGSVKMRGRYSPIYALADARLTDITPITDTILDNYVELDMAMGGMRRSYDGQTSIIWEGSDAGFSREVAALGDEPRLREGYLLIEVDRDDLARCWPSKQCWSRPPQSDVEDWCRRWIESGNGNGMDAAWNEFHADPAHAGLSRDDVFRPAWKTAKWRKG